MSDSEDPKKIKPVETPEAPKPTPEAPKPVADLEAQTPTQGNVEGQTPTKDKVNGHAPSAPSAPSAGVSSIISRSKRDDLLKKGSLVLRAAAMLFSFIGFVVIASNKHGDYWMDFDEYDEYRYLLAITIISTVYTTAQVIRQVIEILTRKELPQRTMRWVDFFCDQILAYLLISSATSAVSITNTLEDLLEKNNFTDSSAASSSMAYLAFVVLALSAMISGFKLSNLTYI